MYLSVANKARLSELSQDRGSYLLSLLLDDLGGPQSVMDVREWMLGRSVFSPRAFQQWWSGIESTLASEDGFEWDGSRLRSTQDDQLRDLLSAETKTLGRRFQELRPVGQFRLINLFRDGF